MDLFESARRDLMEREAPLATRMRPRTLDDFLGQEEIVGPGRLLRRAIEADRLSSAILWGPTGSGKTTLARVIAERTQAHFEQLNAVTSGVADIRRVLAEANDRLGMHLQRTIVFIDEIHRFNKAQQDALLPAVEDGTIILIGATTENPYFEVNSALVSRSHLFNLKPLGDRELGILIDRALADRERGLGQYKVGLTAEARQHLVQMANGDARVLLNALELAVLTTPVSDGRRLIDLGVAAEAIQRKALQYDKNGDQHYDVTSAFIKSMRGSDPDAAIYWLARMIYAGEDPLFIARRVVICAAEDVGMADPQALVVANAALQAVHAIGLPEGRIPLAEAVVYVATAPKSNSACLAIERALADVEAKKVGGVPIHLRDASYRGAAKLGHGVGYRYAHDYPGHYVDQQYLPENLEGSRYYEPTEQGEEAAIARRLQRLRDKRA
ncbi:MAG: replication-associated recombination protein A [Bacillota bacterium]